MRFATIISAAVIAVFAAPALSLPFGMDFAARELEARDANEYGLYGRDIYVKPPKRKNPHPFADVQPVQRSREVDAELYERAIAALLEARSDKSQHSGHAGAADKEKEKTPYPTPWRTGPTPWRTGPTPWRTGPTPWKTGPTPWKDHK